MNRKTFLEKKIVKKFVVDDDDDIENNDVSQLYQIVTSPVEKKVHNTNQK